MKEFLKAVNTLAMHCVVKVLKLDLNTGTYKIIYLDKGENKSTSPLLDDWVKESCDKYLIHPDYSEMVKTIINTEYINKTLKYKKYIHLKLKRMSSVFSEDYKNNVITIINCNDKNFAYLIVYDIDDC